MAAIGRDMQENSGVLRPSGACAGCPFFTGALGARLDETLHLICQPGGDCGGRCGFRRKGDIA